MSDYKLVRLSKLLEMDSEDNIKVILRDFKCSRDHDRRIFSITRP